MYHKKYDKLVRKDDTELVVESTDVANWVSISRITYYTNMYVTNSTFVSNRSKTIPVCTIL